MKQADFERLARRLARRQAGQGAASDLEAAAEADEDAIPDNLTDWLEGGFVHFPHIDTGEPVSAYTVVQRLTLAVATAFAWALAAPADVWRFGADLIVKARRVMLTSLVLAIVLWVCMRWPGRRCLTVAHEVDTLESFREQLTFAVRLLPRRAWRERWRLRDERWEYVHEYRGGKPDQDVFSVWEGRIAGNSRLAAKGVARGTPIHVLHATEIHLWPYPELTWPALVNALSPTAQVIGETTLDGADSWAAEQFQEALQGRGFWLRGIFLPWYADPLKRISRDDERFERALAIELDPEDALAELEIGDPESERGRWNPWPGRGLDPEQIAFRRYWRCQGSYNERVAQRHEYPETPTEAAGRVRAPKWLARSAVRHHHETVRDPEMRVRLADRLSASFWSREPSALILGVYQERHRGRDWVSAIGIDPTVRAQVVELDGQADDPTFIRGLAIVLGELGLLRGDVLLAVARPACEGLLEMCGRPGRDVQVDLEVPMYDAKWSRLQPGPNRLSWDLSTVRDDGHPRGVLWVPRRADGSQGRVPGWTLTGYRGDVAMSRLKGAVEDVEALTLYSSYTVDELAGLEISSKTDAIEGRTMRATFALALVAMALQEWQLTVSLAERWAPLLGARTRDDRLPADRGLPV